MYPQTAISSDLSTFNHELIFRFSVANWATYPRSACKTTHGTIMVIHWWTVSTTTSVICSTTNSKRRTISPITRWARTARWTRPVSDGRSGITFSACSVSDTTITITTRLTSSSSAAWRRSSRAPFVTLNAWPKGITIAWWGNSSTAKRLVALTTCLFISACV